MFNASLRLVMRGSIRHSIRQPYRADAQVRVVLGDVDSPAIPMIHQNTLYEIVAVVWTHDIVRVDVESGSLYVGIELTSRILSAIDDCRDEQCDSRVFYVCANASFTHAAQPFDRRLPCG